MITRRAGPRLDHWGSLASLVAGVLWLLVWLHQREAHGTTEVNEKRVVLGLTWLDSAKFLVAPLVLLVPALVELYRRRRNPGGLGRAGFVVTMMGLGGLIIGTAVEFWAFPWGSYAVGFDAPWPQAGGLIQGVGTLIFTSGLVVLNVDLVRARVVPWWAAPVLVAGGLSTFFMTPITLVSVLAWVLLGGVLWPRRRRGHRPEPKLVNL